MSDAGMNVAEKILARSSGRSHVKPGDVVVVEFETAVLIDWTFNGNNREILRVNDPDKVVIVFDHSVPAPDRESAQVQRYGREFAQRFGITRFHDVGAGQGISHVVVGDNGYAIPGTVLICSDSHTCAAGAFNCAARGTGAPDVAYGVTTGSTWFQVVPSVRYELRGKLSEGVSAKDLFLHIADVYGDHTNQNVEFGGPALASLPMNARRTLATMGAELSAEFVIFEPDSILIEYVKARNPIEFEPQYPDADATYAAKRAVQLDDIEPLVAQPDGVIQNSVPVRALANIRIDQAFIGSCANGMLEDLADAAKVLKGRRVAPGVRLLVTPGSQAIFRAAMDAGYVQTLMEAGAVVTPSTCGACLGGHMGVLGAGETCITSSTRNFKGRMGDPSARIYMASSATVAASAVAGTITHPGQVLGGRT